MSTCPVNSGIQFMFPVLIAGLWLAIIGTVFTCLIIITKSMKKIATAQQQMADAVKVIADKNPQ